MKARALLGLFLAVPAMAQAPAPQAQPVDKAAALALAQCVDHTRTGGDAILSKYTADMAAKGLVFQREPPEFLASTRSTLLGVGQYAKSPSSEGEIWAIGYDSGGCMVVTLGAPVAEIEKGYNDFFTQSKAWRSEKAPAGKPGERTQFYGWSPNRNLRLSAQISLRDADNVTTVTVTRVSR